MFSPVQACALPQNALLARYTASGAYTDCFCADLPGSITHERFVGMFYTTWVFRMERWILSWSGRRPSSDEQVLQVARGERDQFAAWQVEDRCERQILLTDFLHRTRSWLMCEPLQLRSTPTTRLYFGSAIIPSLNVRTGKQELSAGFRALLGFHKLYSVVLLSAAHSRLQDE